MVRVKRFSIGMGKVIASRRAWDTEFALSVLPLGGYVMFEEPHEHPNAPAEIRNALFSNVARWKRAIVIAAGPFMNFLLAFVLFIAVGAIGTKDIVPYLAAAPDTQETLGQLSGINSATIKKPPPVRESRRTTARWRSGACLLRVSRTCSSKSSIAWAKGRFP